MPKLIKDGALIENNWRLIDKETGIDSLGSIDNKQLIVPVKLWLENKELLSQYKDTIGIWFDSDENPALLDDDANNFPIIALNFPSFRDGRSYSHAAILRQQQNFKGDMRAIGDVRRDQVSYMLSCGFSSFLIPDDMDATVLLTGFHDFSENYQSTVTKPTPLFRRR
ncbi:DUF934 domain-containing protein [Haliea sp. AH-315-K21]|nr:DUF934 domain-containing protein [Haliea sp. AH-315-K21]